MKIAEKMVRKLPEVALFAIPLHTSGPHSATIEAPPSKTNRDVASELLCTAMCFEFAMMRTKGKGV